MCGRVGDAGTIERQYHAQTAAFTLVEMLVCIGIISVLMAILMPLMGRAREAAREVSCESNLRQLMLGFLAFSHDHDDQLPGGFWDLRYQTDPDPSHWDWLRGNWSQWTSAPDGGTLFNYVGRDRNLYCCPTLVANPPAGNSIFGHGSGSNGRYDYVSMLDFTGARLGNIQPISRLNFSSTHVEYLATPVIVEGDPSIVNGINLQSWHADIDTTAHTHRGGSYYASIDASVHWLIEPPGGCWNWESPSSGGKWYSLGQYPFFWGQWNRQ